MQRCYYHPKLEAISHCLRCKLTICFHCLEDDLCPECGKMRRFVKHGYTGAEPPRLAATPEPKRSITMELMLDRLQKQVLADSEPSLRPAAAMKLPRKLSASTSESRFGRALRPHEGLIDTEAQAGRKGMRRTRPAKTRYAMAYGFLMPSVSPLIRVSRSPISRMAAMLLVAFSLGAFFARQGAVSATVPAAEAPIVQDVASELAEIAPARQVEVHFKPVYIHVPVRQAAPREVARPQAIPPRAAVPARPAAAVVSTPAQAPVQVRPVAELSQNVRYSIASRQKFAPEAAALPAPLPAGPAKLEVSYPHAGNILRSTPVVRVKVDNPGRLALVNLAIDGTPVKAVPQISDTIEVAFDTTAFPNGDHTLQVLAMEQEGKVIASQTIPITIRN